MDYNIGLISEEIRAAAILTTSYVATAARLIDEYNQLNLLVSFTVGSSSGVNIKIQFSDDKTTWFEENSTELTSGVLTHTDYIHRFTGTGNKVISVPITARWYRVSVQAITDATSTSLSITEVKGRI